ncbi:MAG TPA: hypothetical protein RMH99_04110 [Sandaracinaceae bacterium LLY-WYZ-13_1]|nr:hypothetical protein [Sandaracinaceae bacterium LLY-WYZ-13_1]
MGTRMIDSNAASHRGARPHRSGAVAVSLVALLALGCGDTRDEPDPGADASSGGDDAGTTGPGDDGGRDRVDAGRAEPDGGPSGPCVAARRLWSEDFETGGYERWTGRSYNAEWGPESGSCRENGFTDSPVRSGAWAHRSAITCRSHTDVHRGYGGLEFAGDVPEEWYTNDGEGIDAPHGVVNTFWDYVDTPYDFGGGRWLSLFTVNTDCAWGERVLTVGLDQPTRRLTPAHVDSTDFDPDAPSFPLREWVRVTVYVNAHTGDLHVWQNGQHVAHSRFSGRSTDLCQWHWGAYASGDNDAVELVEDDQSLWKLEEPWTDFSREPWLDGDVPACE